MPFVHAAPPPPFPEETLVCVRAAANEFAVSPVALLSILKVEGGKAGEVHQYSRQRDEDARRAGHGGRFRRVRKHSPDRL